MHWDLMSKATPSVNKLEQGCSLGPTWQLHVVLGKEETASSETCAVLSFAFSPLLSSLTCLGADDFSKRVSFSSSSELSEVSESLDTSVVLDAGEK